MASRIRIKMGALEVEYEGEEDYLRDGLLDFLKSLTGIVENSEFPVSGGEGDEDNGTSKPVAAQTADTPRLAPASIAAKLQSKSGPDLIIAAAAHLKFVQGLDRFSRVQIRDTMKAASGYYKKSMNNNLSSSLRRLVKNKKLNDLGNDSYSLSKSTENELRAKIAV
jgi:hypothetical protein